LLLVLSTPLPVGAHLGAQAHIAIGVDHVRQGDPFNLVVADVSPNASVSFELRRDSYSAALGSAVAGPDGHFETTLTMPTDAPTGFAELIASSPDGTRVATFLMVGPRPADDGPPPPGSSIASGLDPSVIVLAILLGGAVGAVGYLLLRPKRVSAPEPATSRAVDRPRLPRKSGQDTKNR
jgi:hypothetical protein